MTRLNLHVGPVRTQMNNTQKMNNSDMSIKNNPNSHVCSTEEIKSKGIKVYKSESHICSTDKSESKIVIVNTCSLD